VIHIRDRTVTPVKLIVAVIAVLPLVQLALMVYQSSNTIILATNF
jgi:hypothetical protein